MIATHRRPDTPKTLADLAAKYKTFRIEKLDVTDEAAALAKNPAVRAAYLGGD